MARPTIDYSRFRDAMPTAETETARPMTPAELDRAEQYREVRMEQLMRPKTIAINSPPATRSRSGSCWR